MGDIKADLALSNARVLTLDPRHPAASTIYIQGEKIVKVSSLNFQRSLASKKALVIDCAGKTVLPGFHDAHCHVAGYAESLVNLDFSPASVNSIEDIVQKIKQMASMAPAGSWIRGMGYNEFYLDERRHPTRQDLDRATVRHPVKLTHRSGHAAVLNTPAMVTAGITNETEEPPGGMIDRDLESGEPNGILYGMGRYLSDVLPPLSEAELAAAVKYAGKCLLGLGVTSVQDASPGNDPVRWRQFLAWKNAGLFAPRTTVMFSPEYMDMLPLVDKPSGLRSGAVKVVLDEVRGSLNPPQAELDHLIGSIHKRRLQAAVHAVEETTVEAAVKAFESVVKKYAEKGRRHRIEHCSVCSPAHARRLARLGAVIASNPSFIYYSGERYLATVPRAQFARLYAFNTMLQAGLALAAGSDAPVSPPDPLKGIFTAVTRESENGDKVAHRQAISLNEALKMYTTGAAYSCFRESQLGTIASGKLADLVVLNSDLNDADAEELKETRVDMTVLGGKVVYRRTA